AFGGGEWADELAAVEGPLSIAFRPVINEFRGRRTVELHLVDWQAAPELRPASSNAPASARDTPVRS
ncbi:MAG TPA: hypothetical protein VMV10_10315, partial [Pirellulales bacterium]|nr:hypothetical protein [Pirellulales bacterium]